MVNFIICAILLCFFTILFCIFGALFNMFSDTTIAKLEIVLLCALCVYGLSVALYCIYYFN